LPGAPSLGEDEQGAKMPRRHFDGMTRKTDPSSDLVIRSNLPRWIISALRQSRLKRMSAIRSLSDEQLLQIPGIGPRALALIHAELRRLLLSQRMPCADDVNSRL
jgi:hypothetical protein